MAEKTGIGGLSKLQRAVLRLAVTINAHTQGVARVKGGSPVPGYRVPTVDYAGPKDLRPPLVLWAIGGMQPSPEAHGFFLHTTQTRCMKASVTRATTRLFDRGLLAWAPLPKWAHGTTRPDPGYVLTTEGLSAATAAGGPVDVPLLAEACELFGITSPALYKSATGWGRSIDAHKHARKAELIEALRNGYRLAGADPTVTVAEGASVTTVKRCDTGNRCGDFTEHMAGGA